MTKVLKMEKIIKMKNRNKAKEKILSITENGYGKTSHTDYRVTNREAKV